MRMAVRMLEVLRMDDGGKQGWEGWAARRSGQLLPQPMCCSSLPGLSTVCHVSNGP